MRNGRHRQRKTGNTDTDTVRERKLEKQATAQLPKHRDFDVRAFDCFPFIGSTRTRPCPPGEYCAENIGF